MAVGGVYTHMVMKKNLRIPGIQQQYNKQVSPATDGVTPLMPKPLKPSFKKWKEIVRHRQFVAAKQIIVCVLLSGFVIVAIGITITVLSFTSFQSYNPWRLIGPCVIACGLLVMLLCVELCVKRSKIGPIDTDEIDYLQGHSVEGGIHRYGFGNYKPEGTEEEKATVVTPKRIEVKSGDKKDRSEEEAKKNQTLHVSPPGVPDVGLIPPSPHPLEPDESPSQENLELLLSPNSLD